MIARTLVLAAVLLALAAPAEARTIQQDLDDAHAYWQSDVCRGEWGVQPDASLRRRGLLGMATGIGWDWVDGSWAWKVERCEFAMDPGIQGCERQRIVRHEVGHFVLGPDHGPELHASDRAACTIPASLRASGRAKRAKARRR